ncbi:peptidoglycan editing factor PgeF [Undibacterium sp. TJN19]|uniref:peptidoglycan editing factor PgeF n=1 Tax=Undibacterium sp. TJN19 TaxID=3413055 RepID=UPI003BF41D34
MTPERNIWSQTLPFPVLLPDWSGLPAHVRAFTTVRQGGESLGTYGALEGNGGFNLGDHVGDDQIAVASNRDQLNRQFSSDVIFLSQVHGNIVLDDLTVSAGACADAVVSQQANAICAVLTADCLPVLFTDTAGKVVGAAHAGWRGLAAGVLQNTVNKMRAAGAGEIIAWMGPAIGPDQFEVGEDVLTAFSAQIENVEIYFRPKDGSGEAGKYLANIYGLARKLLNAVGVSEISGGNRCTVTESSCFYSYRRDGVTGRMASLIWIAGD